MSHNDIVIFLCDSRTLPELQKSLLKYPAISTYRTGDEQGSSAQPQNDNALIYEIDNKYYCATIVFLLLTLSASTSEDDENFKILADLTSNEQTNKVFVWAFSKPTIEKAEEALDHQVLPAKPILDVLLNRQPDRELNYALHLNATPNSKVDSVDVEETFDELGWEYLIQSYGADQAIASGSKTEQINDVLSEGDAANRDDWNEEEAEEQGIDVILAALQTVMWQGMRRKPKSALGRSAPPTESHRPISSGGLLGDLDPPTANNLDWSVGDEELVERRRNVFAEDADSAKRMDDEFEAWLGTVTDALEPTAESSLAQDRLPAEGFEDDFGPFESSLPGSLPRPEILSGATENPEDELDFDLEVNLESILSQLGQTREDLRNVDDEDERRVRAGREVNRILGMMGMDLGDEGEIEGVGGTASL